METKTKARAVLLAAGQGKRMKSSKPKVLHEVLGRSILSRVLTAVDALDVEHVHVIIGHGSDQVREFLELFPPKTPYSVHLAGASTGYRACVASSCCQPLTDFPELCLSQSLTLHC